MKKDDEKTINISISKEILKSSKLSIDEVYGHLTELALIFKDNFPDLIPMTINDLSTLNYVVRVSENLKKIKKCRGFDEHVSNYNKKQIHSSSFVTLLAGFLVSKVDKLVLEPKIGRRKKKPDIYVDLKGEEVYVECKMIDSSRFAYFDEHKRMFEILSKYINFPHQVSITYRKSLSDDEINRLGETLQQRVPFVTRDGKIINNEDLDVNIIKRHEHGDKRFSMIITGIKENLSDKCKYPMHVFFKNGITMAISGPKVDYSKILKNKIEKSRYQSDLKKPYVLAIDATSILGNLTENLRFLSTRFQPDANTRFSGILLVYYGFNLRENYIEFSFISNPFAKYPVSKNFEFLFKDSSPDKTRP